MKVKSKTKIYSQDVHISIPQSTSPKSSATSKAISLSVIIIAMLLVISAALFAIFYKSENLVKAKIDSLARDYYENYLYENFATSDAFVKTTDLDAVMRRYVDHGFSRITLRQLLLHDADRHTSDATYLREYCDENKTYVQIFPKSPYTRTSYHIDTTYSCNF